MMTEEYSIDLFTLCSIIMHKFPSIELSKSTSNSLMIAKSWTTHNRKVFKLFFRIVWKIHFTFFYAEMLAKVKKSTHPKRMQNWMKNTTHAFLKCGACNMTAICESPLHMPRKNFAVCVIVSLFIVLAFTLSFIKFLIYRTYLTGGCKWKAVWDQPCPYKREK